jgi:hypothetical protein
VELNLSAGRVAFVGSATASRGFAPFHDETWEIWGTGPGRHSDPKFKHECDRWFELHDMVDNDPEFGSPIDVGYYQWLEEIGHEKTVYYKGPLYKDLKGVEIPWDEIKSRHSGYFLDSTVAWMMALLYDYGEVNEIGLFGVDFATDAERVKQRKGAKHFAELFRHRGIKVTIPEISELSFDPEPYPESSLLGRKFHAHLKTLEPMVAEYESRMAKNNAQNEECRMELERLRGTMQTLIFFKDNWT